LTIKENIQKIKKEITDNITILLATKKRTIEEINQAINLIPLIGENYVQEAQEKFSKLNNCKKHFIGHLQTNKVKDAIKIFDCIETIDSKKIADEINKQCEKINKVMPIFIEINIGQEENKNGCLPDEVEFLAEYISNLPFLKLTGLMTMAPYVDAEKTRPYFKAIKIIFDKLKDKYNLEELSMGMSHSYKIAIEEGATLVRLGTCIFGER